MFTSSQLEYIAEFEVEKFAFFAKDCLLIYPPKTEDCVNCIYDVIGKKSSNHYKTGGPVPFNQAICPMCSGTGQRATEVSETIKIVLYWEPKKWVGITDNIRTGNYVAQGKVGIEDFPKIKKTEFIILQSNISPYHQFRCRLGGEPVDNHNITKDKYVLFMLERVG